MRRFLTGYAVAFNRRHGRYGHLFQNRLTEELGLSLAETARQLGVSTSAVWRIVKAGGDKS